MGVFALAFWILKFSLTSLMVLISSADSYNYLLWISMKNLIRIVGVFFQLFFFIRISPSFGCREELRKNKISYFLLPGIMLSQLAVFINSIIDSYSYVVEGMVENVHLSVITANVYHIGEPLHLGFCLHMFLHFVVINNNLRQLSLVQHKERSFMDDDSDEGRVEKLLGTGTRYHSV